ncbi:molybdopterin-dependent oxidoreductase [Sulfurimonas sp.]|uniref:molybdopterin-dependent oxidoreductase n=1 Tax=Sulfurimonas sp. TaxID=2022749 RepID=UPI002B47BEC8|nr:molybdopterin-dependent oxidoreductase [Sulfurimonas sp.]
MQRRNFLKLSLVASSLLLSSSALASLTSQPITSQRVSKIAFPEKKPLITYSDRPPILETPIDFFTKAITPNDEFFVRWHMPRIPTHKNIDMYRIKVDGFVQNPLYLSIKNLKQNYEQVEITAVLQCGGNSRSAFSPITGGIQWGNGAMGCAKFKGVRLNDILKDAKMHKGASWVGLNGDDKAAFHKTANFVRELKLDEIENDVIIAYEMNDEDLPFLNGYPVRLIIPGNYADSWVKMLSNITISKEYKEMFYMDKAYRIPDNECECESPDAIVVKTKAIQKMNVKSIIAYPNSGDTFKRNSNIKLKGVAFDSGSGIKDVKISIDSGKTWHKAELEKELSSHAFRAFSFAFRVKHKGKLTLMAKAINNLGEAQPFSKDIAWNHGGYRYNGIDSTTIEVV